MEWGCVDETRDGCSFRRVRKSQWRYATIRISET